MNSLERVRQALEEHDCNPRGNGQISARCPAHDDSAPSLSVGYEKGQALINCHVGCETQAVIDELGLPWNALFDEDAESKPECDNQYHRGLWRTERPRVSYPYTDEHGQVLYYQRRFACPRCGDPKVFIPYNPTSKSNGLPKGVRVLYRLPEVLAAAAEGRTVYLPEGEKDCDRLAELGHVATTAANGAEVRWEQSYTDALKGADIVVIADNDPAGLKRVRAIERVLGKAGRSVRVVRSPLAKKGADVSDHLDAGLDLGALTPLETRDPPPEASHKSQNSDSGPTDPNNGFSGSQNQGGPAFEPPIPVTAPPLPEFPTERLGRLAPWVAVISESRNVAEDVAAFSALAVISAAIGGRRRVLVKEGWTEMVCLYLLALADSSARKTPALAVAQRPLMEAGAELRTQQSAEITEHNEAIDLAVARYERAKQSASKPKPGEEAEADLAAAREAMLKAGERKNPPHLMAGGDSTMEYLTKTMAEQGGRIAVLGSEATLWKHAAGMYSTGQANIGPLLEGYTGEPYDAGRVSRGALHMPHTAVTLGLIIQPGMVEGLSKQNPDFRESGFLNRFLFALAPAMPPDTFDAPAAPQALLKAFDAQIGDLVHRVWMEETVSTLHLTDAARKVFAGFYNDIQQRRAEGGDLHDITEWSGKLCGQIVRIAACLTLYDDTAATEIDEKIMANAIALADYLIAHARRTLELMDAKTQGGRKPLLDTLAWLAKNTSPGETVSIRQIWRGLNGRAWARDAEMVKSLVMELEELGWLAEVVVEQPSGKRGRKPSPRFEMHPWIHDPPEKASHKSQNTAQAGADS
ncbi:hypothetical protein F4561_002235 [Lipingzhangella halophila]|uniref:Toprim domain-containing protein n=1 Tax=Lipingzhangella halophila TaxID=1783352 RepID=A0A7W7RGF0_9ACTN|nr:YfjI family protein [Lipingzhangella halophila]MBB4931415.1 hypothetical protein [Lipingzhangella halophila]